MMGKSLKVKVHVTRNTGAGTPISQEGTVGLHHATPDQKARENEKWTTWGQFVEHEESIQNSNQKHSPKLSTTSSVPKTQQCKL